MPRPSRSATGTRRAMCQHPPNFQSKDMPLLTALDASCKQHFGKWRLRTNASSTIVPKMRMILESIPKLAHNPRQGGTHMGEVEGRKKRNRRFWELFEQALLENHFGFVDEVWLLGLKTFCSPNRWIKKFSFREIIETKMIRYAPVL